MNIIKIIDYSLTIGSFFWIFLFLIKRRGREYCLNKIINGIICYKCKSTIEQDSDVVFILHPPKKLCHACIRDNAISEVIGRSDRFKFKFDITDEKWSKVSIYLSFLSIGLESIGLLIPILSLFGGVFLFAAQSLLYFRYMSITVKKTQSK